MNDDPMFDQFNRLNDYGKAKYWQAIDNTLEEFDKKRIDLKPRPILRPVKKAKKNKLKMVKKGKIRYKTSDLRWTIKNNKWNGPMEDLSAYNTYDDAYKQRCNKQYRNI